MSRLLLKGPESAGSAASVPLHPDRWRPPGNLDRVGGLASQSHFPESRGWLGIAPPRLLQGRSVMTQDDASVPIPKFASLWGTLACELRNRGTLATY